MLPDMVIKVGHLIPTYYYVSSNDKLAKLESINLESLQPIIFNMGIILAFTLVFIVLTNVISRKKAN